VRLGRTYRSLASRSGAGAPWRRHPGLPPRQPELLQGLGPGGLAQARGW